MFKNPQTTSNKNNIIFSKFLSEVDAGRVVQVEIQGNNINGILSNGDKFTGEFSYGVKEGLGVLIYQNGDKYEGEFKNNMFNGIGEMIRKDGTKEKGLFKNHIFVGDN